MTTDHLTPEQKADVGVFLGDNRGWGSACPWSPGATTSGVYLDFWTSAYQAIDD